MNELGPFVAAVLKDKVMDDLLKEKQRLQKEIRHLQRKVRANQHYVEITGPEGFLVYAEANEYLCVVDSLNTCWAGDLLDTEVWIAGQKLTTIGEIAESEDSWVKRPPGLDTVTIGRRSAEPKKLIFGIFYTDDEEKEMIWKALTDPSEENRKCLKNSCASRIVWEDIELHTKVDAPTEYCSLEREWKEFSDDSNDDHNNDV